MIASSLTLAPCDLEVEVGKAREQVRVEGLDALTATKFVE